jgi:acyl-CoA thioesterase-1
MIRIVLLLVTVVWSICPKAETLLVVGDSISAGYGLDKLEEGWVALLQEKLKPRGIEVINASISGDTTAGGLARIDALLERVRPVWVVIELGGNDGLRGLTPTQMGANLTAMIEKARVGKAQVLLLGMQIPPNYGKRYADMFQSVYGEVAQNASVGLVPFLLEGVGGQDSMMQADGIHPNRAAQPMLLEQVMKQLAPMLPAKNAQGSVVAPPAAGK